MFTLHVRLATFPVHTLSARFQPSTVYTVYNPCIPPPSPHKRWWPPKPLQCSATLAVSRLRDNACRSGLPSLMTFSAGLLSVYYIAMLLMVLVSGWVSQRSIPRRSRIRTEGLITTPWNLLILPWVSREPAEHPGWVRRDRVHQV